MSTSGITADSNADGAIVNMIPKEGGNRFAGSVSGLFSNDSLMSDNLSDELIARGLKSVNRLNYIYDAGFTLGGPIKRDRLWFYGSFREWGNKRQAANKFYNATQGTPFYTPDLSRPAFAKEWYESKAIRVTWRATEKNKFNFFADPQRDCHCPALTASGSVNAPEAFFSYKLKPAGLYQVTWSAPMTNKLLFEAGAGRADGSWPIYRQPEVTRDDVSIVEQSTGMRYNSGTPTFGPLYYSTQLGAALQPARLGVVRHRAATTSRRGFSSRKATSRSRPRTAPTTWSTRSTTVPVSLTQWATPYGLKAQNKDFGFYVQDQWTMKRLTLTYGMRYEYFNGYVPPQHVQRDAQRVGARAQLRRGQERPAVEGRRSARRRGVRPVRQRPDGASRWRSAGTWRRRAIAITQANNPIQTSINSVNRTWNDSSIRWAIRAAAITSRTATWRTAPLNGECGAMANQNFGGLNVTTRYADDALLGYGARGYNWDFTTEVQHQLRPGVSMNGRLLPQLVWQLPRHRQHAGDARRTSVRSASRRRPIRGCRAAAAIRCAACTTSRRRSSARSTASSRRRTTSGSYARQ